MELVNGHYSTEGTVQICKDGKWGTVCDDFWDHSEARVVCRSLGLSDGGSLPLSLSVVDVPLPDSVSVYIHTYADI